MNVREAKDFLVNQTARQAVIDGVPLSDLEKRMMSFTEWDDSGGDPIALNDEFAAQYNTEQYEPKISLLLHHAYRRVKQEGPQVAKQWDQAMRALQKGDHYLLVLWRSASGGEHSPYDQLKLFGSALAVVCVLVAVFFVLGHFGIEFNRRPRDGRGFTGVQTSPPSWLKWPVLLLLAAGYFYVVIWPFLVKRSPTLTGWMAKRISRYPSSKSKARL